LINALLGTSNDENPGYKRDVGLHPTDSGITLITHRDHAKLVRKSGYTAIDSVEVVHGPALGFLEHATLVDTPYRLLACPGFTAIRRAGESCKDRLGQLRREEPEELDGSKDADGEWRSEETAFGASYCEQVASRVNMVCGQRVGGVVSHVSKHIDRFVEEVRKERSHLARLRSRIWKARAALAGRFAADVVLLSIAMFALAKGAPSHFAYLLSMLSDRLFEAVVVGVLSTLVVLALVYVVSGAKNETRRQALRPVLLERWVSRASRRSLAAALKARFDETYDRWVSDLAEMPLRAD